MSLDEMPSQARHNLLHGLEIPVNASELEVPCAECSYELKVHPAKLGPQIGKGSDGYVQSMVSQGCMK